MAKNFEIIAGPCSVESEEQILKIAKEVKKAGATMLRGGAFKPRTSPYTFQGLRDEGIKLLIKAKRETGLPVVSEITDISQLDIFQDVDIIQVGARNMYNYELLKELGRTKKTILIKRGLCATIKELLMSAEYVISEGNSNVILCERGIRTFEDMTRNTLDVSSIPLIKRISKLPIIVDPSHAAGDWKLVIPLSMASVAAGSDGIMVEVHNDPDNAITDGKQSLSIENFKLLVEKLNLLLPYSYCTENNI